MQVAVVRAVQRQFPTRLLFAVPNGDYRSYRAAGRLKAEGVTPGIPDLCMPEPIGRYHGLWIELKQPDNKPSDPQVRFMQALNQRGYRAVWCTSFLDALDAFELYLGGRL